MTASIDAEFDRVLASHAPEIADAARGLVAAVRAQMTDPYEVVDDKDGLIGFGTSPRMRDLYFAVIPHTAYVNLQLADGATLPDPDGRIEGTGKRVRHVKVRSADEAKASWVQAVIAAQIAARSEP